MHRHFAGAQYHQFRKDGFYLSSWAFSFPVAAFNVALFRYAELAQPPEYFYMGLALLGCLNLLILWLSFNTFKARRAGEICKPD
ncbi:hypothetical protein [Pseudoalteromonas qingdaonensis]|uniref:hypothetical protein n=1 Tax=Pseudoalteromonas qingdaonensis TaxID=3131913 RepID=UPI003CCB8F04